MSKRISIGGAPTSVTQEAAQNAAMPTTDQKAALDANPTLSASEPVATITDAMSKAYALFTGNFLP